MAHLASRSPPSTGGQSIPQSDVPSRQPRGYYADHVSESAIHTAGETRLSGPQTDPSRQSRRRGWSERFSNLVTEVFLVWSYTCRPRSDLHRSRASGALHGCGAHPRADWPNSSRGSIAGLRAPLEVCRLVVLDLSSARTPESQRDASLQSSRAAKW